MENYKVPHTCVDCVDAELDYTNEFSSDKEDYRMVWICRVANKEISMFGVCDNLTAKADSPDAPKE